MIWDRTEDHRMNTGAIAPLGLDLGQTSPGKEMGRIIDIDRLPFIGACAERSNRKHDLR